MKKGQTEREYAASVYSNMPDNVLNTVPQSGQGFSANSTSGNRSDGSATFDGEQPMRIKENMKRKRVKDVGERPIDDDEEGEGESMDDAVNLMSEFDVTPHRSNDTGVRVVRTSEGGSDFDVSSVFDGEYTDKEVISLASGLYRIFKRELKHEVALTMVETMSDMSYQCFYEAAKLWIVCKSQSFGEVPESQYEEPSLTFDSALSLVQSGESSKITNRVELFKLLFANAGSMDFNNGTYFYNGAKIMSLGNELYRSTFFHSNISHMFGVDMSGYKEYPDNFRYLMFLTSNGNFSKGQYVDYTPKDIPQEETFNYKKFVLPMAINKPRMIVLNQAARAIRAMRLPTLDAEVLLQKISPVKGFNNFYKIYEEKVEKWCAQAVTNLEYKFMFQNVHSFSTFNKQWRSSVNKDNWFLRTPEFDYYDMGLNFYPRKNRKTHTINRAYENHYDFTSAKKEDIKLNPRWEIIDCMWSLDLTVIKQCVDTAIDISYEQAHSMNVIIRPTNGMFNLVQAKKDWYSQCRRIYVGEIHYMRNMCHGKFPFSGTIRDPITGVPKEKKSIKSGLAEALESVRLNDQAVELRKRPPKKTKNADASRATRPKTDGGSPTGGGLGSGNNINVPNVHRQNVGNDPPAVGGRTNNTVSSAVNQHNNNK